MWSGSLSRSGLGSPWVGADQSPGSGSSFVCVPHTPIWNEVIAECYRAERFARNTWAHLSETQCLRAQRADIDWLHPALLPHLQTQIKYLEQSSS